MRFGLVDAGPSGIGLPIEYVGRGGTYGQIVPHYYPAGEPIIPHTVAPPERLLLRSGGSLDILMTALFWCDALAERGHAMPELYLPYVPGSRQDRLNHEGDYLATLKSVARELNARRFPRVTVLDPHSDVTASLIDRCRVLTPVDVLERVKGQWDGVIAPDGGATRRAGLVARFLGVPLYHAWKRRDTRTGKLSSFGVERYPTGQHLLVVDDICDGGGTFIGLAQGCTNADYLGNTSLDLYVSHGVFSQGTSELRRYYGRIISTDSLLTDKPDVEVHDFCRRILLEGL